MLKRDYDLQQYFLARLIKMYLLPQSEEMLPELKKNNLKKPLHFTLVSNQLFKEGFSSAFLWRADCSVIRERKTGLRSISVLLAAVPYRNEAVFHSGEQPH